LICITGDPPRMGTYPDATAVFDVDAIGLVRIASNLNRGLDLGGNAMGSQTSLLVGAGANPGSLQLDEELRRIEKKVEAGRGILRDATGFRSAAARSVSPENGTVWDTGDRRRLAAHQFSERRIYGERAARTCPQEYMDRMRSAENAEAARAAGVAIAQEMVQRVRPLTAGVQLSAPFGRYEMAIEVAQAIS